MTEIETDRERAEKYKYFYNDNEYVICNVRKIV